MTAPTTRERVREAVEQCLTVPGDKMSLQCHTDVRGRFVSVIGIDGRSSLADTITDAALAAMQPPTETRWVIDRSKGLAAYRSAVREALKAGADIHAQQQAGYRSEFLVNLRDFADGVSDEVLRNAFEAVGAANVSPEHMRCVIRALADQEEGK